MEGSQIAAFSKQYIMRHSLFSNKDLIIANRAVDGATQHIIRVVLYRSVQLTERPKMFGDILTTRKNIKYQRPSEELFQALSAES